MSNIWTIRAIRQNMIKLLFLEKDKEQRKTIAETMQLSELLLKENDQYYIVHDVDYILELYPCK